MIKFIAKDRLEQIIHSAFSGEDLNPTLTLYEYAYLKLLVEGKEPSDLDIEVLLRIQAMEDEGQKGSIQL